MDVVEPSVPSVVLFRSPWRIRDKIERQPPATRESIEFHIDAEV